MRHRVVVPQAAWFGAPYLAVMLTSFVVPLVYLAVQSVQLSDGTLSLANFRDLIFGPGAFKVITTTIGLALAVTGGSLVLGYAVAYSIYLAPSWLKGPLLGVVIAPFFVSVTLRVFGWLGLTSPNGPIPAVLGFMNIDSSSRVLGLPIVALALIQIFLPFAVLPILASMWSVDGRVLRSARSLGASHLRTLVRVTIPLTMPGILTAAVLIFVQAMSAFFVPDIVGSGFVVLLPNVLVQSIALLYNPHLAAAAGMLLALMSLAFVVAVTALVRRTAGVYRAKRVSGSRGAAGLVATSWAALPQRDLDAPTHRAESTSTTVRSLAIADGTVRILIGFALVLAAAVIVLPLLMTIALALSSGRLLTWPIPGLTLVNYLNILVYPGYVDAVARSLLLAFVVVCIATVLGFGAALAAHAAPGSRYAALIQSTVVGPLLLPSLAFGLALFEWFTVLGLRSGALPLLVGHVVLVSPFVARTIMSGLEHLDPDLERAAKSLGASDLYRLRRVVLPLVMPSILTATIFAFWLSFDNFTVSYFFGSPEVRTIPVQLLFITQSVVDPRLAAGATWLLLVSLPLLVVARRLLTVRGLRRVF